MFTIDTSNEFGQRVTQRLADEQVIWLTTTSADGTPQPKPVWYLWENGTFLVYSMPDAAKVRHIGRSPRVALNFNATEHGGDVIVFAGVAEIVPGEPPASANAAYIAKYADGIKSIDMTPESFAAGYSTAIRITPERVRGF